MIILLQDTRTLEYVDAMEGWTSQHDRARIFQRAPDAVAFCGNTGVAKMALIFEFTRSGLNFSLPVSNDDGPQGAKSRAGVTS